MDRRYRRRVTKREKEKKEEDVFDVSISAIPRELEFTFRRAPFLPEEEAAAAAAAEQEQQQREQLDDATTTVETTVKPKRKTKKQVKDDEFIANVLVPGLRRFYAEFKHLNVPKGYEFSKDGGGGGGGGGRRRRRRRSRRRVYLVARCIIFEFDAVERV